MDIEKRVDNLEKLVNSLIKTINNNKFYTDASVSANTQNISSLTPVVVTKELYISDTKAILKNLPKGELSISLKSADGKFLSFEYAQEDITNKLTVTFEPLKKKATLTVIIN